MESTRTAPLLTVWRDDQDGLTHQLTHLRRRPPRELKLCEFSGWCVREIVWSALQTPDVERVRLLLQHPQTEVAFPPSVGVSESSPILSPWHKNKRLIPVLNDLRLRMSAETRRLADLAIRCYPGPPSLRGRSFGDLTAVGWYTHEQRGDRAQGGHRELWGHDNPLVVADPDTDVGVELSRMFNRTFDFMWHEAEPLERALKDRPDDWTDWLRAVSDSD